MNLIPEHNSAETNCVAAARAAVHADRTIDHAVARGLALTLASPAEGGAVGRFVRTGELPQSRRAVLELHADLFVTDTSQGPVYQALARYLRERHRDRRTGAAWGQAGETTSWGWAA